MPNDEIYSGIFLEIKALVSRHLEDKKLSLDKKDLRIS